MPGASKHTRRVKTLNANWVSGPNDGDHGTFELMIITEDDQQHTVSPSPEALNSIIALSQAGTIMAWDPTDRTLIAANIIGEMPWTRQ